MLTYSWIKFIDMTLLLYPCVGPDSKICDRVTWRSSVVNWCVSCRTVLCGCTTLSYTKYFTALEELFRQLENVLCSSGKHTSRTTLPNINHISPVFHHRDPGLCGERQVTDFRNTARSINTLDIELSLCYRLITGIAFPNTFTLNTLYVMFQTIYHVLDIVHRLECFQSQCSPLVQWLASRSNISLRIRDDEGSLVCEALCRKG
jgi:hypothetical protein